MSCSPCLCGIDKAKLSTCCAEGVGGEIHAEEVGVMSPPPKKQTKSKSKRLEILQRTKWRSQYNFAPFCFFA